MDRKTKVAVAIGVLWLCCLISAHEKQPQAPTTTTTTTTTSLNNLWVKMKADINRLQSYFFPPNIDFRGGSSGEETAVTGGGAGEKVKEAVAKSFEKCKSTVENSARSAAHLAKDKVKHTLSDMEAAEADDDEDEL